ncbi:MAG: FGGY family carbohydrate kinase [Thermoanaerobacteraceae bacterium]|nr:FGGY family carbohydrate kinase [Thermoanaerobacteraceae bacterium]
MLFAGLDIGTDGARIAVTDEKLNIKYTNSIKYSTKSPMEGWVEQNPYEIYNAVVDILRNTGLKFSCQELCVTFSSTMHNIMGVDDKGACITPLIIWADTRAREEKLYLEKTFKDLFYKYTGCPVHSTYWPSKILWLKKHYCNKIARYVSIKEYIIYRLTGRWLTDLSVVSTSGIFNIIEKCYDKNILEVLGITEENLSEVVSAGYSFDFILEGKNFKGVMGATDGVLSNLGVGAVNRDAVVLTAGSSSAVRYLDRRMVLDDERKTWCYMVDEKLYAVGEATNSAGLVLNWVADVLGYDDAEEMISRCIPEVPYRQNEIIYIPTMMGERAPGYNESLRGLLYGVSLNHKKEDIATAAYESILFLLKMIYDDVVRVRGDLPEKIIATGGLGLSEIFINLLCYLIGDIGFIPGHEQNTAIGACMMGIKEIKDIDYEALASYLPEVNMRHADIDAGFKRYLIEKYERFKEIYNLLSENYEVFNGQAKEVN